MNEPSTGESWSGNGSGGQLQVIPPDPKEAARRSAIQTGMEEMQAVFADRDKFKRLYEEKALECQELNIAVVEARESERCRLKRATDEAIVAGRKAEAEREVLDHTIEILNLARRVDEERYTRLLRRASELEALLTLIKAGIEKGLTQSLEQEQHTQTLEAPNAKGRVRKEEASRLPQASTFPASSSSA